MRCWVCTAVIGLAACSFRGGSSQGDGDGDGDAGVEIDAAPTVECTPGEPVCDGSTRRTCNASGDGFTIDGDVLCPLSCIDGACYEASNVPVAEQIACAGDLARLAPPAGASVQLSGDGQRIDCSPHCGDPSVTRIDATVVDVDGSPDLALICLSELALSADVDFNTASGTNPALVLFVRGDASIAGTIELDGSDGNGLNRGTGGPGGGDGGNFGFGDGDDGGGICPGLGGSDGGDNAGAGGGGGGFGGIGGIGGDAEGSGGNPGQDCGPTALVPLAGGSGGASGGDGTGFGLGVPGGGGGGAIQIAVAGQLTVTGLIRANGGDGGGSTEGNGAGGGGSGGAILLEGATVEVTGTLEVQGGDGGTSAAGPGGGGATGTRTGGLPGTNSEADDQGGSGGGGGGGRIQINSPAPAIVCTDVANPTEPCGVGDLVPSAQ